jgi:hypothetical protein
VSNNLTKKIWTILGLCLGLAGSPLAMATTINVQPPSSPVSVNDTFSVDIDVSIVSDLYSFQFGLGFSPSLLDVIGISEGPFLPTGGLTFPFSIDGSGTITFVDTLLSAVSGVTGSGVLATITFQAQSAGTSNLDLSNVTLLDPQGSMISATTENGTAQILGNAAVPAPPVGLLLLSGWAGIWLSRRVATAC